MKTRFKWCALFLLGLGLASEVSGESSRTLTFCCSPENDLFRALEKAGLRWARFDSPDEAIGRASDDSAVLILADAYPGGRTALSASLLQRADQKRLRLYLEYPDDLPGIAFQAPRTAVWERGVVVAPVFGKELPPPRLLAFHGCQFLPVTATNVWIAGAKVAGYDTAVYGLPAESFPILFEVPQHRWLVGTTKLSHFVAGRYAPLAGLAAGLGRDSGPASAVGGAH